MRLGLKPALGGYHLRVLSMNAPLEVVRIGSALGSGTRKPDVLLGSTSVHAPFSGVSFDYNGGVHRTPDAFERDARRQNEMLAVDFKNYVLTKSLYDDLDYMDDLVARGALRPRRQSPAPHPRRGGAPPGAARVAAR